MTQAHPPAAPELVRLCAAFTTTQLLPLIHILRHAALLPGRNVLLWSQAALPPNILPTFAAAAASYPFAARIDLGDLPVLKPRTAARLTWPWQFAWRNRQSAHLLRQRLDPFLKSRPALEVWTDEPFSYYPLLLHGLFHAAVKVKVPHGFNLEDSVSATLRENLRRRVHRQTTRWHPLMWWLTRQLSGVRLSRELGFDFDRAYTYCRPSPWAKHSVDMTAHYSLDSLRAMFAALPAAFQAQMSAAIAAAQAGTDQRWILLVLFALTPERERYYRDALVRLKAARPDLFQNHRIVLKPHPVSPAQDIAAFAATLTQVLGVPAAPLMCTLNLELLWHLFPPVDAVVSAPCGSIPFVNRFRLAPAFVVKEFYEEFSGPKYADEPMSQETVANATII
jgi:hypothetical protein